jgi:hypothetical protein
VLKRPPLPGYGTYVPEKGAFKKPGVPLNDGIVLQETACEIVSARPVLERRHYIPRVPVGVVHCLPAEHRAGHAYPVRLLFFRARIGGRGEYPRKEPAVTHIQNPDPVEPPAGFGDDASHVTGNDCRYVVFRLSSHGVPGF